MITLAFYCTSLYYFLIGVFSMASEYIATVFDYDKCISPTGVTIIAILSIPVFLVSKFAPAFSLGSTVTLTVLQHVVLRNDFFPYT